MHNLIFFGSDQYAAIVLRELIRGKKLNSVAIVTDHWSSPSPVENIANKHNLKVSYYPDINPSLITSSTLGLSASFPHLFPPSIINMFEGRLLNLHPSLLPQYRNVAPVPYALAMGDTTTGISLFPIAIGIDNGQLVAQVAEPILDSDTTPTLLNRLFAIGADLFVRYLDNPSDPALTRDIPIYRSSELIFTRRLTRETGYVEWDAVHKLINNQAINTDDTNNPLIKLRLTHHPERTHNILPDLIRALTGYEKVWSKALTTKGELNISLSLSPDHKVEILIAGRPRPISWDNFVTYYLK